MRTNLGAWRGECENAKWKGDSREGREREQNENENTKRYLLEQYCSHKHIVLFAIFSNALLMVLFRFSLLLYDEKTHFVLVKFHEDLS